MDAGNDGSFIIGMSVIVADVGALVLEE